ncbi:class I SAM-dependent methyltransferase [Streptomyces sp. NPDC094448]|uniref:class I SAM-dependent methyltransferase n=1 Tax=Streptomyces sp. NPDC094448 TaxID=3366063 RepID=UPI00381FB874
MADDRVPDSGPRGVADAYDAFHRGRASTPLVARLYALAMGDDHPAEIQASSSCDWPLLGLLVARLRLRPGQRLVDLGCGTGGIGLWLARAHSVHLTGIDISPVAIGLAAARRPYFLPPGRADFRVATMERTGLPDGCADGIVCIDTLGKAQSPMGALLEARRLLRPGGRMALTTARRHSAPSPWSERAAAVGLELVAEDARPDEPAMWRRLYRLWADHEEELRRDVGDAQTDSMIREARRSLPTLDDRRAFLITLRRGPDPSGEPYATA